MANYDITTTAAAVEYDTTQSSYPTGVVELDDTHYLGVYSGSGTDGYVNVFELNRTTWALTTVTNYEFDPVNCVVPNIFKISSTKVLCVYGGLDNDGYAVVLTVNPSTWEVTAGTPLEFDTVNWSGGIIEQIDSTHYLISWRGNSVYGYSMVLAVDTNTNTVTAAGSLLTIASESCSNFASYKVDSNHVLLVHSLSTGQGVARILEVNTSTWAVTSLGTPLNVASFITGFGRTAVNKIDSTHFLVTYLNGGTFATEAVVLGVNTSTWAVSLTTSAFPFGTSGYDMVSTRFANVDSNHVLVTGRNITSRQESIVLGVDDSYAISQNSASEYDSLISSTTWSSGFGAISGTTDKFIVMYQGEDNDGFARVLNVEVPVVEVPTEPEEPARISISGNFRPYGTRRVWDGKRYITGPKSSRRYR